MSPMKKEKPQEARVSETQVGGLLQETSNAVRNSVAVKCASGAVPRFIHIAEVKARYGLQEKMTRSLARRGKIAVARIGSRTHLYSVASLDAFFAARLEGGNAR